MRPTPAPRDLRSFVKGLLREIVAQRRWLLLPLWLLLALLAVVLVTTGNSYLLPALYIAF